VEVQPAVVTEVLQIHLQGGNCGMLWWCPSFLSLCNSCEGARKKLQSTCTCLHFPLSWMLRERRSSSHRWWQVVASSWASILIRWSAAALEQLRGHRVLQDCAQASPNLYEFLASSWFQLGQS